MEVLNDMPSCYSCLLTLYMCGSAHVTVSVCLHTHSYATTHLYLSTSCLFDAQCVYNLTSSTQIPGWPFLAILGQAHSAHLC